MTLGDDDRVQAALAASSSWTALEHYATVASTNDVALDAMREGAPPGLVVVADRQTAGRGRAGRRWTDAVDGPRGPGSLAVSATLRPPGQRAGLVSLAAGLAVLDGYGGRGALRDAGVDATVKWPNDVLLDGRKAAGILVEWHPRVVVAQSAGLGATRGDVLVIGCGLDLDWRGVERAGAATDWTSLAEVLAADVDRGAVLAALLAALDQRLAQLHDDPDALLDDYRAACATLGSDVHATLPGGTTVSGVARGIDAEGRLQVDTGHELVALLAGDVTHVRPAGPT